MTGFLSFDAADLLCKALNFASLFNIDNSEDSDQLAVLVATPQSPMNENFMINGRRVTGQWIGGDLTAFNSIYLPSNALEGTCVAMASSDFMLKSVDCSSRSKFICEYKSWDPSVTQPPMVPTPAQSPNLAMCAHKLNYQVVTQTQSYTKGKKLN